jgi:hypothetical protein
MYSNGGGKKGKKQRNLKCNHGRKYRGPSKSTIAKKKDQDDGKTKKEEYRSSSFSSNRKNARGHGGSGKSMPRRTNTQSCQEGEPCLVTFTLGFDSSSFYMLCGHGNDEHQGHPPMKSEELKPQEVPGRRKRGKHRRNCRGKYHAGTLHA